MPRLNRRSLTLVFAVLVSVLFIDLLLWFGPLHFGTGDRDHLTPVGEHFRQFSSILPNSTLSIVTNFSRDQFYRTTFHTQRPWFFTNQSGRPHAGEGSHLALWPEDIHNISANGRMNDRIINQLMYVPEHYDVNEYVPIGTKPLKEIMLFFGRNGWGPSMELGRSLFITEQCPVNTCTLTQSLTRMKEADAVIFKDRFYQPVNGRENMNQVWILFLLESPYNTQRFTMKMIELFNWTATYRSDSDIVAPYEKYITYEAITGQPTVLNESSVNYAANKSKKVAWFVSNCRAHNDRLGYARALSKYIQVDIYGNCGDHHCSRRKPDECFQMLSANYKFYLAFENSNCRDYITEKLFVNALGRRGNVNIVPIVMGAHLDDYKHVAPPHSFIHVDQFPSPRELAAYLHQLDQDDHAYNQYFSWKEEGVGEFVDTKFWCRVCAMLHAPPKPSRGYDDIGEWWAPKNICLKTYHRKW